MDPILSLILSHVGAYLFGVLVGWLLWKKEKE